MTRREPFAEFAKLDRGIPVLRYQQNRSTAHVSWGDGLLWDYVEFAIALRELGIEQALADVWQRHKPTVSRRSCLGYGPVHGGLTYAPIPLALETEEIVRDRFTRALVRLAEWPRSGDFAFRLQASWVST